MVTVGKTVRVLIESSKGGLGLAARGVVDTMGMGRLRIRTASGQLKDFPLQQVVIEADGEGYNSLRPATMSKPDGIQKRRSQKNKVHFKVSRGYQHESMLAGYGV